MRLSIPCVIVKNPCQNPQDKPEKIKQKRREEERSNELEKPDLTSYIRC